MILFPESDCQQGSEMWMRLRLGRLTGSRCKEILTATRGPSESRFKLARRLIDERVKGGPEDVKKYFSEDMEKGHVWEPEICRSFEADFGVRVERVGFVLSDCTRFGCSPDRLVYGRESTEPWAGFEAKFYNSDLHLEWLEEGEKDPKFLPTIFRGQIHGCMAISGLRTYFLRNYSPPYQPFDVRIEWDEYTDRMKSAIEEFHTGVFLPRLAKQCENAAIRRQVAEFDAKFQRMIAPFRKG